MLSRCAPIRMSCDRNSQQTPSQTENFVGKAERAKLLRTEDSGVASSIRTIRIRHLLTVELQGNHAIESHWTGFQDSSLPICPFLSRLGLSWFFRNLPEFFRDFPDLFLLGLLEKRLQGTFPKGSATQSRPFPKKVGARRCGNPPLYLLWERRLIR